MNGISEITGSVGGKPLVFNYVEQSGTWDAQVPALPSGEYVVDVTAYDKAGNTAYTATMLFNIDLSTIQAKILSVDPVGAQKDSPYGWLVKHGKYQTAAVKSFAAKNIILYKAKKVG